MRFREDDILQIKTGLSLLSKTIGVNSKITTEFRAKLENFIEDIRGVKETLEVRWVDQLGKDCETRMNPIRLIKILDAVTGTLDWLQYSKFYTGASFGCSRRFALLMRENVEGIGPSRAMLFKAIFDGCGREDSVIFHAMDTIFYAGKHAWGTAPWDSSEGHTVWTPAQVLQTISHVYGYDSDKAKELSKYLMSTGLIQLDEQKRNVVVPETYKIEMMIAQWANEETTPIEGLECDHRGLTGEQSVALHKLTSGAKKVNLMIGPGGTGKTYVVSRYIGGLINAGECVLCCAPTGMASKVLNDSLKDAGVDVGQLEQHGVIVLDRALALARFGAIGATVLVVDEASMTSVEHLSLVGLLGDNLKKLVLLGDPSQLRPVEAGQPFKDLIGKRDVVDVSELYTNMRANSEKLTGELAKVRMGVGAIHRFIPMAKSTFVRDHVGIRENPESVPLAMREQLGRWIESTIEKGYVWLAHTNILCKSIANYSLAILQKYPKEAMEMYMLDVVAAYFGAKSHKYQPSPSIRVQGLSVYWTAERHGDKVRIYRGYKGTVVGEYVRMEALDLETNNTTTVDLLLENYEHKIMPWMVKTVHKSQGQTISNVVYLIKTVGGKHNLELAYTAHSRAREDALVVSLCQETNSPRLHADSERETSLQGAI